MPKMILSKEEAREIVYGCHEDYRTVKEEIYDHSRWSVRTSGIFKRLSDGTFWSINWSSGATEYQDERPFDYEVPEFVQVEPREVMVTEYYPVEEKKES